MQHGDLERHSITNGQPVKLSQDWRDVIAARRSGYALHGGVLDLCVKTAECNQQ